MQDWRAIVKDEVKREVKDRREQVGDHSFTHKRKLACGDDSVPDQFQQGGKGTENICYYHLIY